MESRVHFPPPPPTSAMHRRRFALTRSRLLDRHLRPSSDETPQPEHSFESLTPGALAILLWEEETKANVRAIRENRPQTPLSAGAVALTTSRKKAAAVHEAAMVSEIVPVLPTSTATPEDNSLPSSISATDVSVPTSSSIAVDSVWSTDFASTTRAAVQRAGVGKPLVAPQSLLPSATPTSLSLPATRPLPIHVPAVAVAAADLRGVPRLTGCSDENVPEILESF